MLPADVYYNHAHIGRGGWSWYTGAAGWYYRVAVQELLGLKVRRGRLFLEPRLPEGWPGCSAVWRTESTSPAITLASVWSLRAARESIPCALPLGKSVVNYHLLREERTGLRWPL